MVAAMQDPEADIESLRTELWGMVPNEDSEAFSQARDVVVGVGAVSQQLFWQDAKWAYTQGRPFKSGNREKLEQRLNGAGLMTEFQIRQNEATIRKIAEREPILLQGELVVVDEELIDAVLASVDEVMKRFNTLLTPPNE